MKILIVEDEEKTAAYLKKGLQESGFSVDVARDGEQGVHLALEGPYKLVILDILLPRKDGWTAISEIRKSKPDLPILCLTARDAVQDRVRGLDAGADDYLVKPFAFSELLARVRSILRRGARAASEVVEIADLVINTAKHTAMRAGKRLDLTPKEFALLRLLAEHQGEVLPRTLIAESVWDINFDTNTNVIDVHIRRLRSKVDDPFSQKLIHSVRAVGYVLEARDE